MGEWLHDARLLFKKQDWSYRLTYRTSYTAIKEALAELFLALSLSPVLPLPTNRESLLIVNAKGELRTAVWDENRSANSRTSTLFRLRLTYRHLRTLIRTLIKNEYLRVSIA